MFSSDATSSTTTESDVISPPSSPQYVQYNSNLQPSQIVNSTNLRNNQQQKIKIHYPLDASSTTSTSSPISKSTAAANIASAIVRQHSYLNAVRMNDERQQQQQQQHFQTQSQKPILTKQQSFTYCDNESYNSSHRQSPIIYQHNSYNKYNNSYNDDYEMQQDVTKFIDADNSTNHAFKYNKSPNNSNNNSSILSPAQTPPNCIKIRSPQIVNDDDTRRHSYLKATNLYNNNNDGQNDNLIFSKPPQPSNNNLINIKNQKDKQL